MPRDELILSDTLSVLISVISASADISYSPKLFVGDKHLFHSPQFLHSARLI